MGDSPVRFGVVGLGMGVTHCRDLVDAQGCRLQALCDSSPERLEKFGAEFGVRGYATYPELLADPEVDVVSLATPSGTHANLTIQALEAGKHVVCEKPPDVTVEAVKRMIAAQQASGLQVMIIFQARFDPVYRMAREAIQSGKLGKLIGIHGQVHWWRSDSYFVSPGMWKGTWALDGGGSLANQGVHTADLVQWLGGRVTEVYGKFGVFAHQIESEDKTVAVLTFENGALGTLTTTTAAYPGLDRTIMVHGTRGSLVIQDDLLTSWRVMGESEEAEQAEAAELMAKFGPKEGSRAGIASDPFAFSTRGHLAQFEAMANAIQQKTTPPNSVETTLHTVELITAVYESGRTGRPVKL